MKAIILLGQALLFAAVFLGFALTDASVLPAARAEFGFIAVFALFGFGIGVITEVFARLPRGAVALLHLDRSAVWAPAAAVLVIGLSASSSVDRAEGLAVAIAVALGYLVAVGLVYLVSKVWHSNA